MAVDVVRDVTRVMEALSPEQTADAAITVGVLTAVPTALSGAADWADTSEEPRRIGLIHAVLNSASAMATWRSAAAPKPYTR